MTVQVVLNSCNGVLVSPVSGKTRTSQFMYLITAVRVDDWLLCLLCERRARKFERCNHRRKSRSPASKKGAGAKSCLPM